MARMLADLGLQEDDYSELEEHFKQLDLNGDGVIDITELVEVASTLPGITGEQIDNIIKAVDRNGNATVDISEFIAAVVLELEQNDDKLLVKAFEKMDLNGDARITKGELFKVLRQYSGTLEPNEISTFVADTDKDNDAKIDYHEFKALFPHTKGKAEEMH